MGLLLICLVACGLGQDRLEHHLSRAAELLESGQTREALLELRAASQLRPDDRALTLRVAEVAASHGRVSEAIEYYADAYALDPTDDEATLAYASLLVQVDPERSATLVDEVLAREPQNARALLVKAEGLLVAGKVPDARQLVERAQRFAPEDPEVDWAIAQIHEARARAVRARSGAAVRDRRSLDVILAAYDRYVERGGERRVLAALGRARSIGSWTGVGDEARQAYREAIELAVAEGTPYERAQVLSTAADYANGMGDPALERLALEHWVTFAPHTITAWERLAAVPEANGVDAREATFERMLEQNPEDASAHVAYAGYIGRAQGYGPAVEYLDERIGRGMDDAALLAGLVNLQHAHGRPLDAARTLERVQRDYADRPATKLLVARHQLTEKQYDEAATTLRAAVAERDSAEAWRLLARAELGRQRNQDALIAIERAIALSNSRVPENIRIKARIHVALGESRKAALALSRMGRIEPLTTDDRLVMARAYYQSHGAIHGRRILESLLAGPNPHPKAALELARWEMENPNRRPAIRAHLEAVHKRYPRNVPILDALTRADVDAGRQKAALARVTRAIRRHPKDGRLYLTRARVLLAVGRPGEAVVDARRAVRVSKDVGDDAYELLAHLYLAWPDPREPIEQIQKRDAAGAASPDEIALLARLSLQTGNRDQARRLYERALDEGSNLALLKNDLAYLLAESGEDLGRALTLAREAANAPGESLAAADTLGFVYLQSGQYDAAFWQFHFVTQEATPPVAEYWYHLGLALMKLDRDTAARQALAEALRIAPEYPAAVHAMRQLDGDEAASEAVARPS